MEKVKITLLGSESHTRGAKKYVKGIPVPSDDPAEIAYCRARPEFNVAPMPSPKPKARPAPSVEPPAAVEPEAALDEAEDTPVVPKTRTKPLKRRRGGGR